MRHLILALFLLGAACGGAPENREPADLDTGESFTIDDAAEQWVKLALALGVHDSDYVDAYYGPAEWREIATEAAVPLEEIRADLENLMADFDAVLAADPDDIRARSLQTTLVAMHTRIRLLTGEKIPFDEQTEKLFGVVVPRATDAEFESRLAALDAALPGEGTIAERRNALNDAVVIPESTYDTIFGTAIDECRTRTIEWYDLPASENFELRIVTDKPWGGFNYYQGDYKSVIEINTDLPTFLPRIVDVGCHEGYPGHHVYSTFREMKLVEERGWIEYTVLPLFDPSAIIAEGSAEYGVDMAFPGDEKTAYETEVLGPLTGIPQQAIEALAVLDDIPSSNNIRIEIARRYLDEEISREEAVDLLEKFMPTPRERAEQSLGFIDAYGAYIINYSVGYDLIEKWLDPLEGDDAARWAAFRTLLEEPVIPADLIAEIEARDGE